MRPETADTPAVLYVDLHLVHEVTSPQAFSVLRERGLKVRRPDLTVATMDHSTPTLPRTAGRVVYADAQAEAQVAALETNCREFGVTLHPLGSEHQGIVHVIGPELGLTQPGKTIVCGDSHTSTHGAFGALAFGIGTSEVGHVLATQCLLQSKAKTLAVEVEGVLGPGVTAKDLILALIAKIGVGGATGHVIEYRGSAVRALSMEERMTVCNMSIEAGARAGMIAPDDTTFSYLEGRPQAPRGEAWERALGRWRTLPSDPGATFDQTVTLRAAELAPMITYGTNPGMGVAIGAAVPDPAGPARARSAPSSTWASRPASPSWAVPSTWCSSGAAPTRASATCAKPRGSSRGATWRRGCVPSWCPGSERIKRQAEAEGLDRVFREARAPSGARPAARCASP